MFISFHKVGTNSNEFGATARIAAGVNGVHSIWRIEMANVTEARDDVLRVLYGKWLQDHTGEKLRYPSKCCHWENINGERIRIPDDDFDEWVGRFSRSGFNECIDSLEGDGMIELFDTGLDVYYVVAPRGLAMVSELQKAAYTPSSAPRSS